MKAKDLCYTNIYFLQFCRDVHPNYQYTGNQRLEMNILGSYGLTQYDGNMRYSLTKQGVEILEEIENEDLCTQETSVEKEE